jgi:hypothetical protein
MCSKKWSIPDPAETNPVYGDIDTISMRLPLAFICDLKAYSQEIFTPIFIIKQLPLALKTAVQYGLS